MMGTQKTVKKTKDFTRSFKINDINTDKQISAKNARTLTDERGQA